MQISSSHSSLSCWRLGLRIILYLSNNHPSQKLSDPNGPSSTSNSSKKDNTTAQAFTYNNITIKRQSLLTWGTFGCETKKISSISKYIGRKVQIQMILTMLIIILSIIPSYTTRVSDIDIHDKVHYMATYIHQDSFLPYPSYAHSITQNKKWAINPHCSQ